MSDPRALESLLAFWSEAGVDIGFGDPQIDRTGPPGRHGTASAPRPPTPHARAPSPDLETATRLAAAAADLPALGAAISAFDGCPLRTMGARQTVFYRGAADAEIVIVGEGPGAEEDARGEPFVGRAGRLLDAMLAAAGLTGRVFITNTVFWRPPGNRTPTAAEQEACAPFVERAIALVKPRLLLLVGAAAAKAMLERKEGILALRGRWFEWTSRDRGLEIPAMPTLHPAFLLRQPGAKKQAWSDLLTVVERLERGPRPP